MLVLKSGYHPQYLVAIFRAALIISKLLELFYYCHYYSIFGVILVEGRERVEQLTFKKVKLLWP